MGRLAGRHIVITGASSGIGRASAVKAAAEGAVVFLLARRADELDAAVAEIVALGGAAHGYVCDVTDDEFVAATVKSLLDEHGHVDMLVNNAGRSIRRSVYRSVDRMHDFERTMAVNYFGALRVTLALLPQMRDRRFGHIVNVSSIGVQVRSPRFAAYVASKAALDAFSDVAAAETRGHGITFTNIHMPLVDTPMIEPTGNKIIGKAASPEWAADLVIRALVKRPKQVNVLMGTVGEVAHLVAPKLWDRLLHFVYIAYPESSASKGRVWTSQV
jgi:NAD(P)-dependent dehydrogenase (short-subunit alcohol dehydrogenase family)